jgi:hypothetical protein
MTVSAFYDKATGTTVITGKNDSGSAQTNEGHLKKSPAISTLKYYYSDATHYFSQGSDVTVTNQTFSKLLPASCVFTLVSN